MKRLASTVVDRISAGLQIANNMLSLHNLKVSEITHGKMSEVEDARLGRRSPQDTRSTEVDKTALAIHVGATPTSWKNSLDDRTSFPGVLLESSR
ncbi:hypothetical protein [Paraburkholderia sp. JHI869]|uniref:hypothetical protein n=1 Tax=Paraburkholderia sp. JHI869 TaxID=3112959 RepID=UPI003178618F